MPASGPTQGWERERPGDTSGPASSWVTAATPYLITPVSEPQTPAEQAFNVSHTTTRTHIERVFGRWKNRFRCLSRSAGGLRLSPLKACQVIVVTAMLHNIAIRAGLPDPEDDVEEDDDDDEDPPLQHLDPYAERAALYQAGLRVRQTIIDLF